MALRLDYARRPVFRLSFNEAVELRQSRFHPIPSEAPSPPWALLPHRPLSRSFTTSPQSRAPSELNRTTAMLDQTTKEVAGAIFYALLSLYDDAAERESIQLLTSMLETGAV